MIVDIQVCLSLFYKVGGVLPALPIGFLFKQSYKKGIAVLLS